MAAGFGGSVASWTWNGAAATCGSCHGFPPTTSHTGVAASAVACATCHGGTVNADGTINVGGGLHINGKVDGGGESAGGTSCGGCHKTIFDGMTGGVAKVSKHSLGGGDTPLDGNFTWGNPLGTTVAAGNRTCVSMCHSDHPHDLTSPVTATHENNVYVDATSQAFRSNGSATRTSANRARTDFDAAATTGGLCVSCHQFPVDATHPAITKATFGVSAHNYTSNTVSGVPYAWGYQLHDGSSTVVFVRDCTKCHASNAEGTTPRASVTGSATQAVHFSDTPSLLAGTGNPAGAAANFVCYNCHGTTATPADGTQGNRSGKNIQGQIAHATTANQSGHPANDDAVHNSVSEAALTQAAQFGNALGSVGAPIARHASCMDCHDPHAAKPTSGSTRVTASATTGNVAGPSLEGTWGAQLSSNPTFWTTPASGNFTKKTLVAGTDLQATLCFKCHTGYYWGAGDPPAVASAALSYTTGTATAAAGGTTATGTGTTWTTQHVGWRIKNNALGVWHTITAFTNATSITISPAATAAWTGAYTIQTGATYAQGTATATSGSATVAGAGGAVWTGTAGSFVNWRIKNNALGVWHRIAAVASATSLTISPVATAAWSGAYTIQPWLETDVAKEFNPANVGNYATTGTTSWQAGETAGSFHPVLASAGANLGATSNIKAPWTRTSLMTCSDCHESDTTTDPSGPHGSASKFILKGPNTLWNSTLTTGSAGMPASTFCINCHNQDFTSSRFSTTGDGHRRSTHLVACFNCHAAIPHGGPRPGMLNAAAGASANVGGSIAGWDGVAPYYQGGSSSRLGIAAYPTTNTAAWAQSNCGCNSASPH
jgi:hypothetical protein